MRILVIGTHRTCHHRLKDQDHELVLFMPRHKVIAADVTGPYECVLTLDLNSPAALWIDLAAALHRHEPFDAVVAYNDKVQLIAHAIGGALGVPCTVEPDVVRLTANKAAMRQALARHGLPSCRYELAQGREQAVAAIHRIGFPCIIKPVDGEASLGVSKLQRAEDIDAALEWVGQQCIERGLMVEEFLVGEEISVEALSVRGRHHIIATTKKFKNERTFIEVGHVIPAPLEQTVRQEIRDYVSAVLDAFGFQDCPSHTELMLTRDGPRIIETHTRMAGDRIVDLVFHATGVDMSKLVALQSLGIDVTDILPPQSSSQQSAAVWYASPEAPASARLVEVLGVDTVMQRTHIKAFELLRQPGSAGTTVRHSFDRSALSIAVGRDADEAVLRAQRAIDSLEFVYA
jgi:biotin carboxylase